MFWNLLKIVPLALVLWWSNSAISQAQNSTQVWVNECLGYRPSDIKGILKTDSDSKRYIILLNSCIDWTITLDELKRIIEISESMKSIQFPGLWEKQTDFNLSLEKLKQLEKDIDWYTSNPLILLESDRWRDLFAEIIKDYNGITREEFRDTLEKDPHSAYQILIRTWEENDEQKQVFDLIDEWVDWNISDKEFKTKSNKIFENSSFGTQGSSIYKWAIRALKEFIQDGWVSKEEQKKPVSFDSIKSKKIVWKLIYTFIKGKYGIAIDYNDIIARLHLSEQSFNDMLSQVKK